VGAQASFFDFIHKNKLQDNIYPSISIAYQVYLTMPVSKLKLIKTYLRLTIQSKQDLSGLEAVIVCLCLCLTHAEHSDLEVLSFHRTD